MPKKISSEMIEMIPKEFVFRHKVIPVELRDNRLVVGMVKKGDAQLIRDLEFLTGLSIEAVEFPEEKIVEDIRSIYGESEIDYSSITETDGEYEVLEKESESIEQADLRKEVDEVSVITLVNKIITNAIETNASDIHVEAYEGQFRVRYRRDGVLQEVMHPEPDKKRAIISRIKIMADLDIAEKRRPQDGRIRVKRNSHAIDIRVSTLPTDFGEKVVLRILDKRQLNLDIEKLGFGAKELKSFKKAIESPYGMILVTGPTGSGKTTTLYATLNYLNAPEVNILTIEDPIEYNLNGINQSQMKSDIGYTFAKALRSFLRQDPDIIMVGEIRDQETAEIAVRSALTGHQVFSTLHTNNAPDTITRLLDMGQEPYLIASSVRMVIAQRLLRMICEKCKVKDTQPEKISRLKDNSGKDFGGMAFYRGEGCKLCNHTGYLGRTAIFEVMPITEKLKEAITGRATSHELQKIACKEGMRTLQQNAFEKLKQGITTIDEVLRETEV